MKRALLIGDSAFVDIARNKLSLEIIKFFRTDASSWIEEVQEELFRENNTGLVVLVCSDNYLDIGKSLFDKGIESFYVFLHGFLYLCDSKELMQPIELFHNTPYKKERCDEKCILCVRNDYFKYEMELISHVKKKGFTTILMRFGSVKDYDDKLYDNCIEFTTMKGIQAYLGLSEIDYVHCFEGSTEISSIVISSGVPAIYDVSSENIRRGNLILEYMIYKNCCGVIFRDTAVKEKYERQFGLPKLYALTNDNNISDMTYGAEEHMDIEDFYVFVDMLQT